MSNVKNECRRCIHDGFLRLPQVLDIVPVSKTAWWDGIREGRFPSGVKLARRTTAWRVSDIQKLCEDLAVRHDG